jgi:hypothetical protein
MSEINVYTLTFLIIGIIVFSIFYYKKLLSIQPGKSKSTEMFKRLLLVMAFIGLLHIFSITRDKVLKIMLLVLLVIVVTLYNVNYSLKKCKEIAFQYKLTLNIRIIIVIIIMALLLNYANNYELFSFLYEDLIKNKNSASITKSGSINLNLSKRDRLPEYCPDMTKYTSDDKEMKKWSKLSSKEKNNCLVSQASKRAHSDIYEDIYN